MQPALGLSESDLDYILLQTQTLWEELRGHSLFITGGTGFFGCWLLESFIAANKRLHLQAKAVILTRNPEQFKKKCPHLFAEPCLEFYQGDVQDFVFPPQKFSYCIHGATEVASSLNHDDPQLMLDAIVQGTRHTLEFAKQAGVKKFLLVSSGAVYDKQPETLSHVPEDYLLVNSNQSAYALGKRKAEEIARQYEQLQDAIKIARCFTFVGPYLPLTHFAIGNFIKDGLNQRSIVVNGDGTPYRSYLYAADLVIWLWTILFRGVPMRPYNVGSDEALTIRELAYRVAKHFQPDTAVHFKESATTSPAERYVPDIRRAKQELGLSVGKNLDEAIQTTINWHRIRHDTN